MNKPVLYILLSFLNIYCFGQTNLVPNHSFEDTVYCPISTAQPDAVAVWYNPTSASPDYYNACSTTGGGVPENDWGFQYAQDGHAYIGIVTYANTPNIYREYMQVKLIAPLEKDQSYCWSMWISLLDSGDFVSNNIGISLSNAQVTAFGSQTLLPISFSDYVTEIQYDAINWVKIGGTIKAVGGEEYLTLGNFLDDANTSVIQILENSTGGPSSCYFIDNVFLGNCIVELDFPNIFTPNNDGVNDVYSYRPIGVENLDFRILNRWGECVYQTSDSITWDGTFNDLPCNEGVYFIACNYYNLETQQNDFKTGFIQLIR